MPWQPIVPLLCFQSKEAENLSYSCSWFVMCDRAESGEIRVQSRKFHHPECLDDVSSVISSYFGGPCDTGSVVEPVLEYCCCISGPWSVTPSPYSVLPSIDPWYSPWLESCRTRFAFCSFKKSKFSSYSCLRSFFALCFSLSLEPAQPRQLRSRAAMLEPEKPIAADILSVLRNESRNGFDGKGGICFALWRKRQRRK